MPVPRNITLKRGELFLNHTAVHVTYIKMLKYVKAYCLFYVNLRDI